MNATIRHALAVLLTAAVAATAGLPGPAAAEAPMARTQAPGWYRMALGAFEVTALNDGTLALPVDKLLTNIAPERTAALLAQEHLKPPVETSVNAYLVNTGSKLVLIDAGAGSMFGPTLGKLAAHLAASGYRPEQVDEIYITHLHGDHVGGLVSGGKMVFPNAVLRADARETGHWLDAARADAATGEQKGPHRAAMAALAPYIAAGRLKTFDGETELIPGIRALPARGHTPGHTVYAVESQGQKMVVWGDLMHVAAVQFAVPSATVQFDVDPAAAAPQRERAYADAARGGHVVAVAHVSFPGLGRLRADGQGGYRWLPVNYSAGP